MDMDMELPTFFEIMFVGFFLAQYWDLCVCTHTQMTKTHFEEFCKLGQIFLSLPPVSLWGSWGYRDFHQCIHF